MRRVQAYFESVGGAHRTTLVTLEVARTAEERSRGLMHRGQLTPSTGMLFIFDDLARHSMWMKNTFIPLEVLWVAESGRIVGMSKLTPFDTSPRYSPVPVKYAVELAQGWYAKNAGRGPHYLRLVREEL